MMCKKSQAEIEQKQTVDKKSGGITDERKEG